MPELTRGDPELGGFRPLPAGYIPSGKPRIDHRVRDPFGWDDLGASPATNDLRAVSCKAHGPRRRVRKTEAKATIISRFAGLRQRAEWWTCRDLANELLTLDLPQNERAEALFALGYAQEKLGNERQAIIAYRESLKSRSRQRKSS
jgi:hypothetical protein